MADHLQHLGGRALLLQSLIPLSGPELKLGRQLGERPTLARLSLQQYGVQLSRFCDPRLGLACGLLSCFSCRAFLMPAPYPPQGSEQHPIGLDRQTGRGGLA